MEQIFILGEWFSYLFFFSFLWC